MERTVNNEEIFVLLLKSKGNFKTLIKKAPWVAKPVLIPKGWQDDLKHGSNSFESLEKDNLHNWKWSWLNFYILFICLFQGHKNVIFSHCNGYMKIQYFLYWGQTLLDLLTENVFFMTTQNIFNYHEATEIMVPWVSVRFKLIIFQLDFMIQQGI